MTQYIALTEAYILSYRTTNNIPSNYVAVRTSIGGVVFVDQKYLDVIGQYRRGDLTGDVNEFTPVGVLVKLGPTTAVAPVNNVYTESNPTQSVTLSQSPTALDTNSVINAYKYLQIRLGVYSLPQSTKKSIKINLDIKPEIPTFTSSSVSIPWDLEIKPIPLPLTDGITNAVSRLITGKIASYFDQDRVGKTLLNFGLDFQSTLVNWKYDNSDAEKATVLVKLYQPLPPEIELFTELWITRELSPTYLDQIFVVYVPGEGLKLYLRPPNRGIEVQHLDGNQVNNATLQTLLTTGSYSKTNIQDPIIQEWYVTSLQGSELNIDYTSFKNFVFYSSAARRLEAFKQKLLLLEEYDSIISEQSASIAAATSGSGITGFTSSLAYAGYQRVAEQRIEILRSFDGYEQFLYYHSGSAYSSSFSNDGGEVDQIYYLVDATWPKYSGSVISVASASDSSLYSVAGAQFTPSGDYDGLVSWWDAITYIASEYDRQNQNRLVNNLPEYLINDEQSQEFIRFVDMVGHQFDVVKSYADDMPSIFDRDSDPMDGLSPDLIWNIASSFGIDLPNPYAIKQVMDYTIGSTGSVDPTVYRYVASETWKRFFHNQIYILKSKGTKNSLRALMNAYGVLPTTLQIRETSTPSYYTTQSYEVIEEQTNTLKFSGGQYIQIPFSSSSETVQVRFATTIVTQSVLFNVGTSWGVRIEPISSSYATIGLVNSAGTTVASSAIDLFSGSYYNITLQRSGTNAQMWTYGVDDDGDITVQSFVTASLGTWYSGSTLYLGSSGSTWGRPFSGNIDEFRLWSEQLSAQNIQYHALYPALYNGNTTTSARDDLLVRLSFNKPKNLGSSSVVDRVIFNESPYIDTSTGLIYSQFSASNFSNETTYPYSMEIALRNILRYSPNVGGSQFVSNKIEVVDPSNLRYLSDDSGSNIPVLSHEKSVVSYEEKFDKVRSNNIIGFYFSPTDAINDSIIKSIGNIDIQDYIGDPSDLYTSKYSNLVNLNNLYWTYYSYTYNVNRFSEFVQDLLQPMFSQAKKLVPARAKLLTGIVIESHILERNKIKWNPIDTSGYGTFEEDVTPTFYPDAITSQPYEIDSDVPSYEITFDKNDETIVYSEYNVKEAQLDTTEYQPIEASPDWYETSYDLTVSNIVESTYDTMETSVSTVDERELIQSEYVYFDSKTAELAYMKYLLQYFGVYSILQLSPSQASLFNQLLATYSPGSQIAMSTGQHPYTPNNLLIIPIYSYSDLGDLTYTQYFTQIDGIVLIPIQQQVRLSQTTLNNAGTWTRGTTYSQNDYVTQTNQTGAAAAGDDYEYVCITPYGSGSFISYNPPSLDVQNWRRMKYITQTTYDVRIATEISGTVQLTNSGSGYTPFVGYNKRHYRFTRDSRLGTLRRIWYGCKQSDDTTSDGGPAVEIIPSAGDILVVSTGAEPIQRTNDNSGPYLDVK